MRKKDTKLDILYQSDNNYAVVTGVSIVSLLENNQDISSIVIHLIDGGITKQNLAKIQQIIDSYKNSSLNIIDGTEIEERLKQLNCRPYKGSYVTYYKLLAYAHIPTQDGRILMLDGDILVLQSLADVCMLDIEKYIMAEVPDPYMPRYLIDNLNLPEGQPYFGAGVMLINQRRWQGEKCEQQIIDHWQHHKSDYLFADQDITNVLFGNKIKRLHAKYNFYSKNFMLHPHERVLMNIDRKELEEIHRDGPVCVHCIDESWRSRPWFKGNQHTMAGRWDYYLSLSPWKGWSKLDTKINLFHRLDKLAYYILPKFLYAHLLKFVSHLFSFLNISKRLLDSKKMNVTD